MIKSPQGVYNAMLFECLRVQPGDGFFPSPRLYAVEGLLGLWRRIRRERTGLQRSRQESVLAHFMGSVIELVRDPSVDEELKAAGIEIPPWKGAPLNGHAQGSLFDQPAQVVGDPTAPSEPPDPEEEDQPGDLPGLPQDAPGHPEQPEPLPEPPDEPEGQPEPIPRPDDGEEAPDPTISPDGKAEVAGYPATRPGAPVSRPQTQGKGQTKKRKVK